MSVQAGKEAPDFTAKAFHQGAVEEINLSDYKNS